MNHYNWLWKHLPILEKVLDLHENELTSLIVCHGDKCYGYQDTWEKAGVPFEHGVALYLLTYISPYSKRVRETPEGFVPPVKWVIEYYPTFKRFLESYK